MRVIHDHRIVATHPAGSATALRPAATPAPGAPDDLVVTDPAGTQTVYAAGTWSVGGEGVLCGYVTPGLTCPICSPQAQSASPAAKA